MAVLRAGFEERGDAVSPAVPIDEVSNLVIEAISLLGQRQREIETWAAERIQQAEERAAAAEARYFELERRIGRLETQLGQVGELDVPRVVSSREERLSRLREQVEGLRARAGLGSPPPTRLVVPDAARGPGADLSARRAAVMRRLDGLPNDRLAFGLVAAGALIMLYAVIWQIAIALGLS